MPFAQLLIALRGTGQRATTANTPVAQPDTKWPEDVATAVFRILDEDLRRECNSLSVPKNQRPATCRNAKFEQSDIDRLATALGQAAGHTNLLTPLINRDVSHTGHTIVARPLINAGYQPHGEVLMFCDPRTQRRMVHQLAAEIHR